MKPLTGRMLTQLIVLTACALAAFVGLLYALFPLL